MANYNQSTRRAIADVGSGMRIETATLAAATYLAGATQTELFTVKGRVLVTQLYLEVVTTLSAHAQQVLFNCTFTTPSIVANAMCAKCASTSGALRGLRVVFVGGVVATDAVITDSAGLSDVTCVSPHIVGGIDFVGTIGILSSDAAHNSGTFKAAIHYLPYDEGSYITSLL